MSFRRLSFLMPGGRLGRHQVLLFHRVLPALDEMMPDEPDEELFDRLVQRLARDFNVIALSDAVARSETGSLPSASLSITFDDGYADNFTAALPILEKYRVPATFFIATGFLNGGRMWNDTLVETARRLPVGEFIDPLEPDSAPVRIASDADRREFAYRAIRHCKYLPLAERDEKVNRFASLQDAPLPDSLMMTDEQVRQMHASAYSEVGAHTRSHPILAECDDAQALQEVSQSVDDLENILGERPSLFAYPNGQLGKDFLAPQTRLIAEAGLEAAVTTDWGVLKRDTDPFQIPRFSPWGKNVNRIVIDVLRARFGWI